MPIAWIGLMIMVMFQRAKAKRGILAKSIIIEPYLLLKYAKKCMQNPQKVNVHVDIFHFFAFLTLLWRSFSLNVPALVGNSDSATSTLTTRPLYYTPPLRSAAQRAP